MAERWWVSWFGGYGDFELHSPWWVSGYDSEGVPGICAAVIADDETAAQRVILQSFDDPPETLEWRFIEEKPDDWSPFNGRFRRADWMAWPS